MRMRRCRRPASTAAATTLRRPSPRRLQAHGIEPQRLDGRRGYGSSSGSVGRSPGRAPGTPRCPSGATTTTTGRKIERVLVPSASTGLASRAPSGSTSPGVNGRCQVRFDASCTSGGSVEASTTSAPAAREPGQGPGQADRLCHAAPATSRPVGRSAPGLRARRSAGPAARRNPSAETMGPVPASPGQVARPRCSACRATAVSSSHRIAELPGPTISQYRSNRRRDDASVAATRVSQLSRVPPTDGVRRNSMPTAPSRAPATPARRPRRAPAPARRR